MKIIGLSGKMKSGKSTVAEYLNKQFFPKAVLWGYGREVACEFVEENPDFKWNHIRDFEEQEVKSKILPSGKTVRDELLRIGNERRKEDPEYWVKKVFSRIREWEWNFEVIIITGVRFPNEVKAIQDMGGIVIRLTRSPVESDDPTETALDSCLSFSRRNSHSMSNNPYGQWNRKNNSDYQFENKKNIFIFDHVIDNANMDIDTTNKLCLKIAQEYLK